MKNSLLIVKDFTFTGLCAPFKAIYAKMLLKSPCAEQKSPYRLSERQNKACLIFAQVKAVKKQSFFGQYNSMLENKSTVKHLNNCQKMVKICLFCDVWRMKNGWIGETFFRLRNFPCFTRLITCQFGGLNKYLPLLLWLITRHNAKCKISLYNI